MLDKLFSIVSKNKKEILAAIGIVILFLVSRVTLIGNFPMFTDEAIYVRWAQIAENDASWRFISLTDGKQPLFVWFGMVFLKFIEDPLTAVRLVSVLSGFFSLIGLFFLSFELFRNKTVAYISSLMYAVFPFALVYDRLALYDSMVGAFAIWGAYFSVLLVRRIRLDIAYTLGLVIGGGMLTKSNAQFLIYSLPFTLLLFDFKRKLVKRDLVRWVAFVLLAIVLAEVIYNFLRLSPFFHIIGEKNTIFIYPFSEWIKHPFTFFFGNLKGLTGWLFTYLTPFFVLLTLISFLDKKYLKEKLVLVVYFALPFVADALFGKVIFPRHIFFASLYLLPLAAFGLYKLIGVVNKYMEKRHISTPYVMATLIIVLFLLYPMKVSADFIFNPANSAIADADKRQYISEWPAGGGLSESIKFFEDEASKGKIFVGTQGTFGLLPAGLEIYLGRNPNVTLVGYWPVEDQPPQELFEKAEEMPTYVVFYQPCSSCEYPGDAPDTWPLELVEQYQKSDNTYYSIYRFKSE